MIPGIDSDDSELITVAAVFPCSGIKILSHKKLGTF